MTSPKKTVCKGQTYGKKHTSLTEETSVTEETDVDQAETTKAVGKGGPSTSSGSKRSSICEYTALVLDFLAG